jgi:hypothetical protein
MRRRELLSTTALGLLAGAMTTGCLADADGDASTESRSPTDQPSETPTSRQPTPGVTPTSTKTDRPSGKPGGDLGAELEILSSEYLQDRTTTSTTSMYGGTSTDEPDPRYLATVANTGSEPIGESRILVEVYNAEGEFINTLRRQIWRLDPGTRWKVNMSVPREADELTASTEIVSQEPPGTDAVEITETSLERRENNILDGSLYIQGSGRNQTSEQIDIILYGQYLNSNGDVIGAHKERKFDIPGETAFTFEVSGVRQVEHMDQTAEAVAVYPQLAVYE